MIASLCALAIAQTWDDVKWIAGVDGMGIPLVHVSNLMRRAKIPAAIMGSLSYGVSVEHRYVTKATNLLRADAKLRPYHYIRILGMDQKDLDLPDISKWKVIPINATWDELASNRTLIQDANLHTLAKNALRQALVHWTTEKKYECVKEIAAFQMEYLANDFKWRKGYKAEVRLANRRDSSRTGSYDMYAWENGSRVVTRSGGLSGF